MKSCRAALYLALVACSLLPAEPLKPNFPWDCPNPKGNIANDTIFAGFVGDLVGVTCMSATAPAFGVSTTFGAAMYNAGIAGYTFGAFLMDMGVNRRHVALEKMKFKIKTDSRGTSRALTTGTLVFSLSGLGCGVAAASLQDIGFVYASLGCGGVAALLEIINVFGPRQTWIKDINQSVSGKREKKVGLGLEEDKLAFAPIVSARYDEERRRMESVYGLSLTIKL